MAGKKPDPGQVLSEKQLKFCQEYVLDLNSTQAAIRAGYAEKSAAMQACVLLTKPHISSEVERLLRQAEEKSILKAAEVLQRLSAIADGDPLDTIDDEECVRRLRDIPKDLRKTIQTIEVFEEYQGAGKDRVYIGRTKKIKFWDKNRALDTLAKYHRLLTEGTTNNIQINNTQNNFATVVICLPPKKKLLE